MAKMLYTLCVFVIFVLCTRVGGSGYDDSAPGLTFGGQFVGRCDSDGMYYMDDSSYVMCSHSIAYIMPCAPGTRNSGRQLESMQIGEEFGFTAFCDVNLVDVGYAAFISQQAAQSSGYGSSGGSSGYSSGSSGSSGYGGSRAAAKPTRTSYSSSGQRYGQQKPALGNILVSYLKQYSQTQSKRPSPMYTQKSGYSQQQKGTSGQGYGQAQRTNGYGQILGYSGNQKQTSYSSPASYTSYGGNTKSRNVYHR